MLVAGHSLGSTGGHCDSSPFPPERVTPPGPLEGVCNGPEECRLATRQAIEAGVDRIEHGSFLHPDTLRLMKQKGVSLVPQRLALAWTAGPAAGQQSQFPAKSPP